MIEEDFSPALNPLVVHETLTCLNEGGGRPSALAAGALYILETARLRVALHP